MNTFINIGILATSFIPLAYLHQKQPDPGKLTQITLGVGGNDYSGGSIPHIAVFDEFGHRVTQFKGKKNGHIGDKAGNTIGISLDNYQNHNTPALPEYVLLSMQENDGICLASVVASGQAVQWAWTGDMGFTCGAQWYPSKYTMGNSNQPIRCVWLDANHDKGIIAKGLSLHIRDFSGEAGILRQYNEDQARLCQNSARMTFHPDIASDSFPTFFTPHLEYRADQNPDDPTKPSTAGALAKPDQGKDRNTRAYPDGTKLPKLRRRDLNSRRRLKVRGVKSIHSEVLTISHMQAHSAKELCDSDTSLGPDFVSIEEGLFCDMETAKLWPLCTATKLSDCFSLETHEIHAEARKRDAPPAKTYTFTDEWK